MMTAIKERTSQRNNCPVKVYTKSDVSLIKEFVLFNQTHKLLVNRSFPVTRGLITV